MNRASRLNPLLEERPKKSLNEIGLALPSCINERQCTDLILNRPPVLPLILRKLQNSSRYSVTSVTSGLNTV